jgi:hypothetical protein
MASYMDYAVENADQTGMLLGKAADAIMGVEDEEAAVDRIIKNADWSTSEGIEKLKSDVRGVSMDAYKELVTQLSNTAQTEANITQIQMQTENAKIERAKALFTPSLQTAFNSDVTVDGQRAAIEMWLDENLIKYKKGEVLTTAAAAAAINKHVGTGSSTYITDFNNFVKGRMNAYVTRGIYAKAGLVPDETVQAELAGSMDNLAALGSPDKTKKTDDFVVKAKNYDENDSQWTSWWKEAGRQQDLSKALQRVNVSMINLGLETFMSKTDKGIEDREDAIQKWIGGGSGEANAYFYGKDPAELDAFVADPVGYYKSKIALKDDDLFANIPYNLDVD